MTESPCQGCKYLQRSWRRGNAAVVRWICGKPGNGKCLAVAKCVDYVERVA